jgi:hypothetical protein
VELVQSGLIINCLRMLGMVKVFYFGLIHWLKVEYFLCLVAPCVTKSLVPSFSFGGRGQILLDSTSAHLANR